MYFQIEGELNEPSQEVGAPSVTEQPRSDAELRADEQLLGALRLFFTSGPTTSMRGGAANTGTVFFGESVPKPENE